MKPEKSWPCVSEPKHEILLAFSAYSNGKKILKTSQDSGQILFFNGMKVLSMFWVITGHRYQWSQTEYINVEEAEEVGSAINCSNK